MINYVTVVRHENKHAKLRHNGKEEVIPDTSPRQALKQWINSHDVSIVTIYEAHKESGPKELICWYWSNK